MSLRSGGQILGDQLAIQGVDRIFCVPGESYLPLLDALRDGPVQTIVCRHEGAAGMMAEADAKLTGRPGVVCVTRGPGAGNVAHAVHIAEQDSTPLIVIVGQVPRAFRGRGASQEVDCAAMFGGMAKWVVEAADGARLPEIVHRAFVAAMSGRPGPVVIAAPEDMLYEATEAVDAVRAVAPEPWPSPSEREALAAMLAASERPVVILGGSRWSPTGVAGMQAFAARWKAPVACSFRRQMLFDARSPHYVGELGFRPNPDLVRLVQGADLVLLVGGRLNDVPSGDYTLLAGAQGAQTLVHVHPEPSELGRVYHADLPIACSPDAFVATLADVAPASPRDATRVAQARDSYLAWSGAVPRLPGRLQMGEIMRFLRDSLPADAILTNGAGNYASWPQRFYRFSGFGTQLAPVSGSMGYGLPAAIAARLRHPSRQIVAFAGDGCFTMTGQEFATAVQYELPLVVIVIDNGMYGSIRMHQEQKFPGRDFASALRSPDFVALARAYGGHGERVETAVEFEEAFARALHIPGPSLLHCLLDPEAITAQASLSEIRARALRARG